MVLPSPRRLATSAALALLVAAPAAHAQPVAQPDFQFGWNATGGPRNVALVMVRFADTGFAASETMSYYGTFFNGGPGGNQLNVRDYFLQSSGGAFTFQTVTGIADMTYPDDRDTDGANESMARCFPENARLAGNDACRKSSRTSEKFLATIAELLGKRVNLSAFDLNRDGRVDPAELTLVVVVADGGDGGANRTIGSGCAQAGAVRLCGSGAIFGQRANLATMVHELFHTFSRADLYTPFNGPVRTNGGGATIMGATIGAQPRWSVAVDPWNRIRAGWVRPRVLATTGPGACATLDASLRDGARPASTRAPFAIWDPALGGREYFLVEYRRRDGYDNGIDMTGNPTGGGALVWYVKMAPNEQDKHWFDFSVVARDGRPFWSQPAGGDDEIVYDANGRISYIGWGKNHRLETAAAGSNVIAGTNFVLAGGLRPRVTPQGGIEKLVSRYGFPTYVTRGDGPVRLLRPDGVDTGVALTVGPDRGDGRVFVRIATPSSPAQGPSGDAGCLTATMPDNPAVALEMPPCVTSAGTYVTLTTRVRFSRPLGIPTQVTVTCDAPGTPTSTVTRTVPAGVYSHDVGVAHQLPAVGMVDALTCSVEVPMPPTPTSPAQSSSATAATYVMPPPSNVVGAPSCGSSYRLDAVDLAAIRQLGKGVPLPPFDPRALGPR